MKLRVTKFNTKCSLCEDEIIKGTPYYNGADCVRFCLKCSIKIVSKDKKCNFCGKKININKCLAQGDKYWCDIICFKELGKSENYGKSNKGLDTIPFCNEAGCQGQQKSLF